VVDELPHSVLSVFVGPSSDTANQHLLADWVIHRQDAKLVFGTDLETPEGCAAWAFQLEGMPMDVVWCAHSEADFRRLTTRIKHALLPSNYVGNCEAGNSGAGSGSGAGPIAPGEIWCDSSAVCGFPYCVPGLEGAVQCQSLRGWLARLKAGGLS